MASFADRTDAGRQVAARLNHLSGLRVVVLGLPRGGVVVAAEVARQLDAPLDVLVVRKLGVPSQEELAMGAIGEANARILNQRVIRSAGVSRSELDEVETREREELARRLSIYRGNRPAISLHGKVAVIVDDGIATGATAKVACTIARSHGADRVVLAVPIAPQGWAHDFGSVADEYISVIASKHLGAIGQWYDDFTQTSDKEVTDLLAQT